MLGTLNIEEAATKAAANWRKFDSFIWWREQDIHDSENWTIYYSQHRDSGLLDQSNAHQIAEALEPFTEGDDPDVVMESHSHWAVGHIDGFSLRVFDANGEITEAFKVLHDLAERMADYPVLSDSDYSQREYDATLDNIKEAAWRLKREFVLPDGWESEVFSWLWDHDSAQVENRDDVGGYPSEESLRAAFEAIGYKEQE